MMRVEVPDLSDPNLPKVKLVSGVQWEDAQAAQRAIHNSQRFREPLPLATWNSMRTAAQINFSREVCGLVDSRFNLHFVRNDHPVAERNFHTNESDLRRAVERIVVANDRIIGIFHTHPGGDRRPSRGDIDGWPNRDLNWRYWIATRDDVYEWEYENQPEEDPRFRREYLGKFNDQ